MTERHFTCPKCGSHELVLVRDERTSRTLCQVKTGGGVEWEHGKEEVLDCMMAETRCGNGHPLVLRNGATVQDDLKALEQWFTENSQASETFDRSNAMEEKDYYLLVMVGDVDPHLSEPFQSEEERDQAALDFRQERDPEGRNGLFKLDLPKGAAVFLSAYSSGFFEEEGNG